MRVIGYIKKLKIKKSIIITAVLLSVIMSTVCIVKAIEYEKTVQANATDVESSQIIDTASQDISSEPSSPEENDISSEEGAESEAVNDGQIDTQNIPLQNEPQAVAVYTPKYPARDRVAYLTFDDGPSDNTLKILDILKENEAVATFFVIGRGNLDYLTYIEQAGCKIGLHSSTHSYSTIYSSVDSYLEDLESIQQSVYEKVGHKTDIIRFPGGSSNTVSRKYSEGIMSLLVKEVEDRGYAYFDWNVSSGDATAVNLSPDKIKNNVLETADSCNSICVLFHDSSDKRTTVDALPQIICGLKEMGYHFEVLTTDSYGYHHRVMN